tara:strand:+ start:452 stop:664 length:213 start_codon:yes stop_codon:yes gene_type:complete
MLEYTIDNNTDLKGAYDKGVKAAKAKHKRWGHTLNRFHVSDNPYERTGSFGKKLKAAWHNGFKGERACAI